MSFTKSELRDLYLDLKQEVRGILGRLDLLEEQIERLDDLSWWTSLVLPVPRTPSLLLLWLQGLALGLQLIVNGWKRQSKQVPSSANSLRVVQAESRAVAG